MLPRITELQFNTEEETADDLPEMGKSFLYDTDKGDFVYRNGTMVELHGKDALKMWIIKTIKTERYRFRIYENTEYGTTIEDLIGTTGYPRAFVESEIKREVTTSLLRHPYIDDIQNWQFVHEKELMRIKFRVITPLGDFDEEVRL